MEFLVTFLVLAGVASGWTIKWYRKRGKEPSPQDEILSFTHYKREKRESEVKEWGNEYISTLQNAFLLKYKIPYDEARTALREFKNYTSAKKYVDSVGDRAYWFVDCPKSSISKKSVWEPDVETTTTFSGSQVSVQFNKPFQFVPDNPFTVSPLDRDYSSNLLRANLITAEKIYVNPPPNCPCESCEFNDKLAWYNRCKRIWDSRKEYLASKYPEFVFDNLPKELPELSA